MTNCRVCGVLLFDENWYPCHKRINSRICKECDKKQSAKNNRERGYGRKHKKKYNENRRKAKYKMKVETLIHYSETNPPQCANPFGFHKEPFTDIDCLTIDHINDDGAKERRLVAKTKHWGGVNIYWWLSVREYPEGYQVFCMNCQFKKEALRKRKSHSTPG